MEIKNVEISKFLSRILRHEPGAIGLTLDSEGWANISSLINCAKKHRRLLSLELIQEIVKSSDKKRFVISNDGKCIRAVQGHSINTVSISYLQKKPPEFLFHGTATRFVNSILSEGLNPKARQYVHLSCNEISAYQVGCRHGKPAVILVKAIQMHEKGFIFFLSDSGVWLTKMAPPEFLTIVSLKH
jgi:putative RNA 2'-phosphotransferase